MKANFARIYEYYKQLHSRNGADNGGIEGYKSTEVGLWAYSRATFILYFFKKLSLNTKSLFLDAGAGDGLVVAVASLFTRAIGIERDFHLTQLAKRAFSELELQNASMVCANFLDQKIHTAEVVYIYPDKPFEKLTYLLNKHKWCGELWVYGPHIPSENIIKISRLKKGRDFLTVYKIAV